MVVGMTHAGRQTPASKVEKVMVGPQPVADQKAEPTVMILAPGCFRVMPRTTNAIVA